MFPFTYCVYQYGNSTWMTSSNATSTICQYFFLFFFLLPTIPNLTFCRMLFDHYIFITSLDSPSAGLSPTLYDYSCPITFNSPFFLHPSTEKYVVGVLQVSTIVQYLMFSACFIYLYISRFQSVFPRVCSSCTNFYIFISFCFLYMWCSSCCYLLCNV